MPFDLFIHALDRPEKVPARELEQVLWPEDLPIKEVVMPGYRDRYALVSGAEFAELASRLDEAARDEIVVRMEAFGRVSPDMLLILHWEEWESGM